MNTKLLLIILLSGFYFSCGNRGNHVISDYIEQDRGDSIFYYRDFDWCNFKGIEKININELKYPFVKTIYRNGKLILKVHYSKDNTNQITFFKLQDKWCNHSCGYVDGELDHYFEISLDTMMLRLSYMRNPLDTSLDRPAKLYNMDIVKNSGDTVIEHSYSYFYDDYINSIPDLDSFREDRYVEMCKQFLSGKDYRKKDSLVSGYTVVFEPYQDTQEKGKWNWQTQHLRYGSMFYFYFENRKDCDYY
jgi:hypothetical protein